MAPEKKSHYGVYMIDGKTKRVHARALGYSTDIDAAINNFRKTQASPILNENKVAGVSNKLYKLLIKPLSDSLGGTKRLLLAPTGAITLLPFETLSTGNSKGYWSYLVEDYEIAYIMTSRDIIGLHSISEIEPLEEFWIIGDPDYNIKKSKLSANSDLPFEWTAIGRPVSIYLSILPNMYNSYDFDSSKVSAEYSDEPGYSQKLLVDYNLTPQWSRLSTTGLFSKSIASEIWDSGGILPRIFLGSSASERKVLESKSPQVLILASHGKFFHPLTESYDTVYNYLDLQTRSAIILAGANTLSSDHNNSSGSNTIDDGILTAYEVAEMDLRGTELVILVGCESGIGVISDDETKQSEIAGETIAGLRKAFSIAGGNSIIMSMWPVPLQETINQMSGFVNAYLENSLNSYEDFRNSQLNALKSARRTKESGHPFWWGGFIFMGYPSN
jgi:CHAT domain-containing protein